jgi:predicted NACHT family NTPase
MIVDPGPANIAKKTITFVETLKGKLWLFLTLFPSPGLDRVVVIAGPGFGKSALTLALATRIVERGRLPAILSIPELSRLDAEIGGYLRDHLNKSFEIAIDWTAAAETGLLVLLLDGLDEVSSDRRAIALERIKTFSLRYPTTPWILTVRDAAALAAPTDALLVELEPLNDHDIQLFIALYRPEDPSLPERLSRRFKVRPDLQRLVRIPLFLAILLTVKTSLDALPSSRTELLETRHVTVGSVIVREYQGKLHEVLVGYKTDGKSGCRWT